MSTAALSAKLKQVAAKLDAPILGATLFGDGSWIVYKYDEFGGKQCAVASGQGDDTLDKWMDRELQMTPVQAIKILSAHISNLDYRHSPEEHEAIRVLREVYPS